MKFILDENLPPRLARILRELEEASEHDVLHLATDLDFRGAADEEWLSALDSNDAWVILTHDSGIRNKPHELEAWRSRGHVVFFLARGWQSVEFDEIVWRLVRWWREIVDTAEHASAGEAYMVPFKGGPGKAQRLDVRARRRRGRRR